MNWFKIINKMNRILIFTVSLFVFSCISVDETSPVNTKGYKPIYRNYESIRKIESLIPQKLKTPGKIYTKDNYLYINEIGEGIHIYDNSDKTKPVNISFISIPANKDISIIGDILYADNGDDLVVINIANPLAVKLEKRVAKAFPYPSYPPLNGSFECADSTKGYIIDWIYTELSDPKCFR
jgi:hypothetical protein